MLKALLVLLMIFVCVGLCQPRAVGIWLALAQGGYDAQSIKQQIIFDDEAFNDKKRYNP